MGRPWFFACSNSGEFTFWLLSTANPPASQAYSIDITGASGRSLMGTIMAGFAQKAQQIAVYTTAPGSGQVTFVVVYPAS
jgi:hypothetical protein